MFSPSSFSFDFECPVCKGPIAFHESTCADERGNAFHEDCYVRELLERNRRASTSVALDLGRSGKRPDLSVVRSKVSTEQVFAR